MKPLPKHWVLITIGEIADIVTGKTPPTKQQAFFDGPIPFAKPGDLDNDQYLTHAENTLSEEGAKIAGLLPIGTVLVSCIGNLGKSTILAQLGSCNQQINAIKPTPIASPEFIYFWVQTIKDWMEANASATTVTILNKGRFEAAPFPLPPATEQRRIVAKLDALFARTRQAREELERIPALIEHYKQAILAAAFRGELTADWREEKQPEPVCVETSSIDSRTGQLPEIPAEWGWTSLNAISEVSGGLTKNAKRREIEQKIPYLRVANVYANELRLDEVKEIGCTDTELAKTQLKQGDLLVVEGNGSIDQIGRVAIWDGSITPCSHQNHLIRVRPGEQATSRYILYWMLSPLGRQYIERVASSSSGLHTLSITKVSGLAIPVCTIGEQEEVIRHIEEAYEWLDFVLDEATSALRLLDHLDQATLAKAFRGELVPQDPDDEPASVLLERIRAARAEGSNGGRRQKRK